MGNKGFMGYMRYNLFHHINLLYLIHHSTSPVASV